MDQNAIIQRARNITGNKEDKSAGEIYIDDPTVLGEMQPTIRALASTFADSSGYKEVIFSAVANQQDYDIETYVGTDVSSISAIYRSAAYTPDYVLNDDRMRPLALGSGEFNTGSMSAIPAGLQAEVFRTIVDGQRADRAERFTAEQVGDNIRLFPPPVEAEVIAVQYVTSSASIDDLPEETENALVYSAVVAILNGILNRLAASPLAKTLYDRQTDLTRLKAVQQQRDYYADMLSSEIASIS